MVGSNSLVRSRLMVIKTSERICAELLVMLFPIRRGVNDTHPAFDRISGYGRVNDVGDVGSLSAELNESSLHHVILSSSLT